MKKKVILLMSMLLLNTSIYANEYTDIEGNFAEEGIINFDEMGYFQNIIESGENTFKPKEHIKRGEVVVLLLNSYEITLSNSKDVPFVDFQLIDDKYQPYITTAYEIGLISGKVKNEELYFDFNDLLTKEELATMIGHYLSLTSDNENDFTDSEEISNWAKNYVNYFYENEIIIGDNNGKFNPKNNVRRDEAVAIISNIKFYLDEANDNGFIVSKYIGSGEFGYKNASYDDSTFTKISDITFDNNGDILILDSLSNKIRNAKNYEVTDVVGQVVGTDMSGIPIGFYSDGEVKKALLENPKNIMMTKNDMIAFTEDKHNAIRTYNKGNVLTLTGDTKAGYKNGDLEEALFNTPSGIAEDSKGNIYVADTLNHVIRKIDMKNKEVTLFAGTPEEYGNEIGEVKKAKFNEPVDIFIDENDTIYISDAGNNAIKMIKDNVVTNIAGMNTAISPDTETQIGGDRDGEAEQAMFSYPKGIYVYDDIIYVADTFNNKIKKIENGIVTTIAGTGEIGNDLGKALKSTFNQPNAIIVSNDIIYIADTDNQLIKKIDMR